jgi:hypothetical protein
VDRDAFYRKNKAVMRGWTFLGSTTLGSLMIVATLAGRIDIYFWGRIVAANVLAAVLFFVQQRIDGVRDDRVGRGPGHRPGVRFRRTRP